jgi:hypothetical protein
MQEVALPFLLDFMYSTQNLADQRFVNMSDKSPLRGFQYDLDYLTP